MRNQNPHNPAPGYRPRFPRAAPHRAPLSSQGFTLQLSTDKVIGNGSFGVVFEARVEETSETVAIKRVLQDKRFKNRELQIMKMLKHTNVVSLKHYFTQSHEKTKEDGSKVRSGGLRVGRAHANVPAARTRLARPPTAARSTSPRPRPRTPPPPLSRRRRPF